jgi:hypothetical protein
MPSFPKGPHGTSIPPESNKKIPVAALLHRSSTLPPYTMVEQPVDLPSIGPAHDQGHDAPFAPPVPPKAVHQYTLRSRGRDYARITIASRAKNAQDHPLLHFGEELEGSVVFSPNDLNDMRSIDVVVSFFFFFGGVIAIERGACSYRCSNLTLPHHRMRLSAFCYRTKSIIPMSPTANFAGPLASRPLPF